MDIIRFTIANPVKVTVGVLLATLFGILALFQIPIQLTPNVDEPRITVTTLWRGKSVQEIEREIIDRQEEMLKGVPNLRKMTSTAREGVGEVVLEFFVGIDKDIALRDTTERLNRVSGYPPEVDRPEIAAADAAMESPIAWLVLRSDRGDDVTLLRDFVWDNVKPILERVEGLAQVDVFGGREREVHVLIDPALLAARSLTLREVEQALGGENVNVSAGTIEKGKRDYPYRTVGEYEELEQVENTVIAYREGGPVFVRDVGEVIRTFEKPRGFVRSRGIPVLGMPVRRESGANVMQVMAGLRKQIEIANNEILHPRGLGLELTQVYDETVYITSAIRLVRTNLLFGGSLAVIVLMLFLRNWRATGVVAVAIPISVVATFLVVTLFGRTMNVVMLAGMAFAVGMVVDNAVVVLENIYRHRQMGKSSFDAAYDGATEVWGAVLAATLTTLAVFIPVIFVEEEAGQLFRDISIAISAGVGISLLVSVLVIPSLSARALSGGLIPAYAERGGRLSSWIADLVAWINRRWYTRVGVIVLFVVGSVMGSWKLMPPTDYLPSGNRNLVFGFVLTEPGLGVEEFTSIAQDVENYLRPYWEAELGTPEAEQLPKIMLPMGDNRNAGQETKLVEVRPAPIEKFFFVARNNACFMGATSKDPLNVKPLTVLMPNAVRSARRAVGAFPIFFQTALFGSVRGGNSIDVEVRGNDLNRVTAAASMLFGELMQADLGMVQPDPSNFDLPRPEIQAVPNRVRAADVGLNVRDVGFIVEAAVDGARVGGFRQEGKEIDLLVKLKHREFSVHGSQFSVDHAQFPNPENLQLRTENSAIPDVRSVPVYTDTGRVVPLSSVVDFRLVGTPQQINHIEEMPGITLRVRPPPGMALESAMLAIENDIIGRLRQQELLESAIIVSLAGNADKLVQTRRAMFGEWSGWNAESLISLVTSRGFLALLIVYLLMAGLFESFIHPLAIMLTVPLATVGGFAGLRIVHGLSMMNPVAPIQQLDVVTMLGFVILVGIVVNNAILIVHQTLNNISYGLVPAEALHQSVQTRIRPIFMTAMTTICGQLPLALMPGAGSELYRGLAAVMVGGLLVATVFTIVLVPVVFSFFLALRTWIMVRLGRIQPVRALPLPTPAQSRDAEQSRDRKGAVSPPGSPPPAPPAPVPATAPEARQGPLREMKPAGR